MTDWVSQAGLFKHRLFGVGTAEHFHPWRCYCMENVVE